MKDKIRQVVYEEYGNTLGIVACKDNKKVYEDYFNNATKDLGQKIGDAIFVILIPGFFMFIVFVCQLVTGLIQIGKDKESKNFTSKILTIISLVQLSLLCMLLFLDLNSTCETSKLCIFIALLLSALCLEMHIRTLCKIKSLKKEELNQTPKA